MRMRILYKVLLGGGTLKLQKMGMRTIKTGISVTLCMILGDYLVENMFYSLVACIISVQDTVKVL